MFFSLARKVGIFGNETINDMVMMGIYSLIPY